MKPKTLHQLGIRDQKVQKHDFADPKPRFVVNKEGTKWGLGSKKNLRPPTASSCKTI